MRKILYGAAAALLFGGAALADDVKPSEMPSDTQQTKTIGPDKVITNPANPSGPAKPSDMATEATQMQPSAMADQSPTSSMQGEITKVKHDKITLKAEGGKKHSIFIDDRSAILRDGQAVNVKQLKKGDEVRVSYDLRNGKQVATTITATSRDMNKKGSDLDKPGHNPSGSSIQQPAPGTGESTRPDSSIDDRSTNGNTPGTMYRKETGDVNPNTNNAGVNGNIGVQPGQDQTGQDPYGRGVNPKSTLPPSDDSDDDSAK